MFYVYILTNKSNHVFYTGFTGNVEGRCFEHKQKDRKGSFTEKYNVYKLVYYEEYRAAYDALVRERQIKRYKKEWKRNLIEKENPLYKDLAENWFETPE